MPQLPTSTLLRLSQILGDRKAEPATFPIIPVSKSQWWEGVNSGRFPKPFKLGPRTTVWRSEDIQNLIDKITKDESLGEEL